MSINKAEQETSIWFNNEDDTSILYTCNRSWINYMDKLCSKYPDTYKLKREIIIDKEICGKEYIFSRKYISKPRKPSTRVMSEEQKLAASIRLSKNRSKNQL